MRTAVVAFALAALIAAILTPLLRNLAFRFGLFDHAHSTRKVHIEPVPRLGGIAIVLAFFAPLLGLLLLESSVGAMLYAHEGTALGLFVGGLAIATLGIYDDLRGASAYLKFSVQISVAAFMYWLGFRIDLIANPFGAPLELHWFAVPFTIFWIVGVINAMNLIDGLDGLAGGVALFGVLCIFIVAAQHGEPRMMLLMSSLGGAILGFLFYNFNPASIFMGDTGSMFLGFVLATSAIQTRHKSSTTVALLIPIISLGLPILDTILALARRALRGLPLFTGDREHIHHRLLAAGLSHRQAVLVLYGVCLLFALIALTLTFSNSAQTALLLVAFTGVAWLLLSRLGYIRLNSAYAIPARRRRNLALRSAVEELGVEVRGALQPLDIWRAVKRVAPLLGASMVELRLVEMPTPGERTTTVFSYVAEGAPPPVSRSSFRLAVDRDTTDVLELGWSDRLIDLDRDTEATVELLCTQVAETLERLRNGFAPAPASRASFVRHA